jgi:hypothetical protein
MCCYQRQCRSMLVVSRASRTNIEALGGRFSGSAGRSAACGIWVRRNEKSYASELVSFLSRCGRILSAHGARYIYAQSTSGLGGIDLLFGSSILAASVGSALKLRSLNAVSEGLWVLMGLIFFGAWGVGFIVLLWQLFNGQTFNWFRAWKLGVQVGPIDIFPPVTPKMRRESQIFTVALLTLVCIASVAALLR